jgi:hypothetical protein
MPPNTQKLRHAAGLPVIPTLPRCSPAASYPDPARGTSRVAQSDRWPPTNGTSTVPEPVHPFQAVCVPTGCRAFA